MQTESFQQLLRIAVPAGLIAGSVMGVIARISMRLFALADGSRPSFSVGGSLAVVAIFAVIFGIPLALVYVRFWSRLDALGGNGLAYGAVVFLVLVAIPFMLIPSDEANLRMRLMAIASFLPVPLAYGLALSRVTQNLLTRL